MKLKHLISYIFLAVPLCFISWQMGASGAYDKGWDAAASRTNDGQLLKNEKGFFYDPKNPTDTNYPPQKDLAFEQGHRPIRARVVSADDTGVNVEVMMDREGKLVSVDSPVGQLFANINIDGHVRATEGEWITIFSDIGELNPRTVRVLVRK